jgi:ribosomal protein S18 acetylase RimI-like enzyme
VGPHIRPYRSSDREELVALWALTGLARPWNNPYRDIERKLARDADNLLVLEDDDQIVGSLMIGYEGHRGWVNYLAVHPDRRQEGLGRQLMAEAERRLQMLGCAKINLQVRSSNHSAVDFYRHLGYDVDEVISLGKRLEDDTERP